MAAPVAEKSRILNEFAAASGYNRKYAIYLLNHSVSARIRQANPKRRKPPKYDREVREALIELWQFSNRLCGKRLAPFMSELIAALERHGRLRLPRTIRKKLLAMSAATIDRLLRAHRRGSGQSLTRSGPLLKKHIPVRTFADWNDVAPGFLEADTVAHCGESVSGVYLQTLVLTDVYTGWVEPYCLSHKSEEEVLAALDEIRGVLPFPLLGLDTDNGTEFINHGLIDYCAQHQVTFTRSRPYKKNDQCRVEQKNGAVVRRAVGFRRYEGAAAQDAFNRLYAALRLFVNFFQPSMKLVYKERTDGHVRKKYELAKTPYRRLLESGVLTDKQKADLNEFYLKLDPHDLLYAIEELQDDLLKHAKDYHPTEPPLPPAPQPATANEPSGEQTNQPAVPSVRRRRRSRSTRTNGPVQTNVLRPGAPNTSPAVAKEDIERIVGESPSWRAKRIAIERLFIDTSED